jgi:hypothetical protein
MPGAADSAGRKAGSFCRDGGKVFGDLAADDAGCIASVGAMQLDREPALIVAIGFLIGNVDHVKPERRLIGMLMDEKIGSHCLFQVVLYFLCRQLSLTAGGDQEKDG